MLEPLFRNVARLADTTELYRKIYMQHSLIDRNVLMINMYANIS